jgi:hypothetical protein
MFTASRFMKNLSTKCYYYYYYERKQGHLLSVYVGILYKDENSFLLWASCLPFPLELSPVQ